MKNWKLFTFTIVTLLFVLSGCTSPEQEKVERFENGMKLLAEGNHDEARLEALNTLKLDPQYSQGYLLLGRCMFKEQNWQKAYSCFRYATELSPELHEAYIELSRLCLLGNNIAKAREAINKAMGLAPTDLSTQVLHARILIEEQKFKEAHSILAQLLQKHPSSSAYTVLATLYEKEGELEKAMNQMQKASALNPENSVLLMHTASLATKQQKLKEAEEIYLHLKDIAPGFYTTLLLARFYETTNQFSKTEQEYQAFIQADLGSAAKRLMLASFYHRQKKWDKALATLQKALSDGINDIQIELTTSDVYMAMNKPEQAETLLRQTIEAYPGNPLLTNVSTMLSQILLSEKRYKEALEVLDEAILAEPSPDLLFLRGKANFVLGNYEDAVGDLRIVTIKTPQNTEAHTLLAQAHMIIDNRLMAVEQLHSALDQDPAYIPANKLLVQYYMKHGHWDKAEDTLLALLNDFPDEVGIVFALGDVEFTKGTYDAAKKWYMQALELAQEQAPVLIKLGDLAVKTGHSKEGIAYYEKVLQKHPESAIAIERKVLALLAVNPSTAQKWIQELLAATPHNPALHELAGRLALHDKNQKLAIASFKKAINLEPKWIIPYRRLTALYIQSGQTSQAITECLNALKHNPDSSSEAYILGQLYQHQGHTKKAKMVYLDLLKKRPDFLPAANNAAYLIAETESEKVQLEEGLKLAKKAAQIPSSEALDTLGWLYFKLGHKEKALDALRKAKAKKPEDGSITYHLAVVLEAVGNKKEARRIGEEILKTQISFPERSLLTEFVRGL